MFITLTKIDQSGRDRTPITINVDSIVTMTDAYIVGKPDGTNITLNFTGTDKDGVIVLEPRRDILSEIARLSEVRRG